MKWGVRRYQNKDGSLTKAGKKRLADDITSDYNRANPNGGRLRGGKKYKDTLSKKTLKTISDSITDEDKKRIRDARDKWRSTDDRAEQAFLKLDRIANKYNIPGDYTGAKAYKKAEKERPDLAKLVNDNRKNFEVCRAEEKKVVDKIIGKYGKQTVQVKTDIYSTEELRVRNIVDNILWETIR
jgi:hypothetical protein